MAESNGGLDGWISAYRPPDDRESLFIWQVAVHERARGSGLGVAMLERLVERSASPRPLRLKTTVTPSNAASRSMFAKFAQRHGAAMRIEAWFDQTKHFGGSHESEELISIGPL
jgi:L-2,4-diaminobutyric acid acetyltransferase